MNSLLNHLWTLEKDSGLTKWDRIIRGTPKGWVLQRLPISSQLKVPTYNSGSMNIQQNRFWMTIEEIEKALMTSSKSKTPGADGIPIEVNKDLRKVILLHLLDTLEDAIKLFSFLNLCMGSL